jgi:N-methylhydantoinase A
LGYLNPETFSGGIDLDVERGLKAIKDLIATPLGLDPIEAALGMHRIVNSNMAQTLRLVSIKRGYDPREFAMVPCGGAGPVHAGRVAEESHIQTILVPPSPGVLSAMGLMLAPLQHESLASFDAKLSEISYDAFADTLSRLDTKCCAKMAKDGVSAADSDVEFWADMRYVGQSHELQVLIAGPITEASIPEAEARFHEAHERTYNHANRDDEVEFAFLRVVRRQMPEGTHVFAADAALAKPIEKQVVLGSRKACFSMERGFETVNVHSRKYLRPGDTIKGPAIVDQSDTTTVIYPGHVARVDPYGNMIIQVHAES